MSEGLTGPIPPQFEFAPRLDVLPPIKTRVQYLPFGDLHWEDFEKLCLRLARVNAEVGLCRLYGVTGQRQEGIDFYGSLRTGGRYQVYQCKRVKQFGPAKIRAAVNEFVSGEWLKRTDRLFLCTSGSLRSKDQCDVIESQRERLRLLGVELEVWDSDELSAVLKLHPDIVADFFGESWVNAFCGERADRFAISTAKLPSTSPLLIGRETELSILDSAWATAKINLVSIVAPGGEGKTALINAWLNRLQQENWRGAGRVFGLSFFSQGSADNRPTSADMTIEDTLEWFGDSAPTDGSDWNKGVRLAVHVRRRRTLLVLDGLEPLQDPNTGTLTDLGVRALVRELARDSPGLCVITTRLAVEDVSEFEGTSMLTINLDPLTPQGGAEYLRRLGVIGDQDELMAASEDFGGNALAITLLGRLLVTQCQADIQRRAEIPPLRMEHKSGQHARRVMEYYEKAFHRRPELVVLRVLGLFDRPAARPAVEALRSKPVAGLTKGISEHAWTGAIAYLEELRLIHMKGVDLDCHPLIREHFAEELVLSNAAASRNAHNRLYQHFRSAVKELPDHRDEITTLLAAVVHGCLARKHRAAFEQVLLPRIHQGKRGYLTQELGAYGADLAALSYFFESRWTKAVPTLSRAIRAWLFYHVAFDLRALGRPLEAAIPMEASFDVYLSLRDWVQAAVSARNLCGLQLTLGNFGRAIEFGELAVELAERNSGVSERAIVRATLANAYFHVGDVKKAQDLFFDAENIGAGQLHSLAGFRYCELLMQIGNYDEVAKRAAVSLSVAEVNKILLDVGLHHLSLARACHSLMRIEEATQHFNLAVDELRTAGRRVYFTKGLIYRSEFRRQIADLEGARADLRVAHVIASRGGMRLYEAECHLQYAHLYLALNDPEMALKSFGVAKTSIEEIGYHRRRAALAELASILSKLNSNAVEPTR